VEQIDRRRAEQRQIRRVDDALERRLTAAEENHELAWSASMRFKARREPGQLEKRKARRKRKILLQQTVALKRPQRHAATAPVVGEADRLDRVGRKKLVPPLRAFARPAPGSRDASPRHSS